MKIEATEMVTERVSIMLPRSCIEWIDKQVEARAYYNRSHTIEVLII
ncbi:MAG: ribbon-helix-helix domain-containing protein [Candidatus Bathyarchaeota archaeon]|nr:ribbon-helix-helix domain-containing protein [Candidatus Bathyarchaeota archaeon]MDH5734359.1 ribbon-helix-helix domain-containing protein [Candidatus Bathyarchaeota archaeon]